MFDLPFNETTCQENADWVADAVNVPEGCCSPTGSESRIANPASPAVIDGYEKYAVPSSSSGNSASFVNIGALLSFCTAALLLPAF